MLDDVDDDNDGTCWMLLIIVIDRTCRMMLMIMIDATCWMM